MLFEQFSEDSFYKSALTIGAPLAALSTGFVLGCAATDVQISPEFQRATIDLCSSSILMTAWGYNGWKYRDRFGSFICGLLVTWNAMDCGTDLGKMGVEIQNAPTITSNYHQAILSGKTPNQTKTASLISGTLISGTANPADPNASLQSGRSVGLPTFPRASVRSAER